MHVFIKEGLEHLLSNSKLDEVRILEVGLGTGLNAFLTANFAMGQTQKIRFTSLEPFPIKKEIYEHLNYADSDRERELMLQIHEVDWESDQQITSHFTLHKTVRKLENFESEETFDIIYFDAFAPSKQAEVWSLENLKNCYSSLNSGGVLTTYCAQGQFKRNLVEAGFEVETLQGAMGKKEMVRAVRH